MSVANDFIEFIIELNTKVLCQLDTLLILTYEREKKKISIWKQTIDFSLDGLAIDKLKMILATKMSRIIAEA